jgi:hypothetical protein
MRSPVLVVAIALAVAILLAMSFLIATGVRGGTSGPLANVPARQAPRLLAAT